MGTSKGFTREPAPNHSSLRSLDSGRFRVPPRVRTNKVPRACPRGFTFIELILVVLLVGVIVGLAAPRLNQALQGQRADNFAYDLSRLVSTLGQRAIADTRIYRLAFNPDYSAYWVETAEENEIQGGQLKFKPANGRYGRKRLVPERVQLKLEGEPVFFPSGEQALFTLLIYEREEPLYSLRAAGIYGPIKLVRVADAAVR